MFRVVLKNLSAEDQKIVLSESSTLEHAQSSRKQWRSVLGNKNWSVDRRPGLDSLEHLALTIESDELDPRVFGRYSRSK